MIQVNQVLCTLCGRCVEACPFAAVSIGSKVLFSSGCKLCGICVKACPEGAISIEKKKNRELDRSLYRGILVYVEHYRGEIHPITYELLGEAAKLSQAAGDEVYAIFIGSKINKKATGLIPFGAKKVFVYDAPELRDFRVDLYADMFSACLRELHPSVVLVGATSTGRSLAPRVATRARTGLTADCTTLLRRENSDLVQIRPAFGGNIMAQILTANHRPQFATVRHRVMEAALSNPDFKGEVVRRSFEAGALRSGIEILHVHRREPEQSITDAEVLVVAGRGARGERALALLHELAELLDGQVACTRPMVESGALHYSKQIGLSGRTVKPRLIIACGVSGAVQFTAGMNGSEYIVAINTDRAAPVFQLAHLGLVGDMCEIVPRLISEIRQGGARE